MLSHFAGLKKYQPCIPWLAAILLPLVWLWPTLVNPSFSLIDDPTMFKAFWHIDADFWGWLTHEAFRGEIENGRLRPMYWLTRYFLPYKLLPNPLDPLSWHIAQYVFLIIILTNVFVSLRLFTKSLLIPWTACTLWILNAKTMENFVRLATAEVWQLFWLSLIFVTGYWLCCPSPKTRKELLYVAVFFFLFMAYFCKETSVLLLPVAGIFFIGSLLIKRRRQAWFVFFLSNLLIFLVYHFLSPPITGYTSAFKLSPELMLKNIILYAPFIQWHFPFCLTVLTFLGRRLVRVVQKRSPVSLEPMELWQWGSLILGTEFLLILLPWALPEQRYLVMVDFFFAIFMAIECRRLWDNLLFFLTSRRPALNKRSLFISAIGAAYIAVLVILGYSSQAGLTYFLRYEYGQALHRTPVQSLEQFSKAAKPGAKVLIFYEENEIIRSVAILLGGVFDRKDLELYTFSQFADNYRKQGYPFVQLKQGDWPAVLHQVDYVYWSRQGMRKLNIDLFHTQLMNSALNSIYITALRLVYSDLYYPIPGRAHGTQVWEINKAAIWGIEKMMSFQAGKKSAEVTS